MILKFEFISRQITQANIQYNSRFIFQTIFKISELSIKIVVLLLPINKSLFYSINTGIYLNKY